MDFLETMEFILEYLQEVNDIKSYIHDFHHNRVSTILILEDIHFFKFYVEEDKKIKVGRS